MDGPVEIDITAAAKRIIQARRVIVTTHARADGDAIGSALAMDRVLASLNKEATVYFHEPIPPRYDFLPDAATARVWPEGDGARRMIDASLSAADLILIVDTCAAAQLECIANSIQCASCAKLAIDHHVTRDPIVDEVLLDTSAGACTQIVARLCEAAEWTIDADTATLLFAGLATDTGWFRHSNANAAVFASAAMLIDAGARPNELYERLYLSEPEPRVRLMGAVMSSFEMLAGGRLALIRVTREMLRQCGANSRMTEEIINETHRAGSVVASAMFVEPEADGEPVRVSLRSKRDVNVAAIARIFGGGGHERAAGAKLMQPLDESVRLVVDELLRSLG